MAADSLLNTAHRIIAKRLQCGQIALDATLGNGHDTLFLARCVGANGLVYGFDVQTKALEAARKRLEDACLLALLQWIPPQHHGKIQAAMFNLGYLPGGDKTLITQTATTLAALEVSLRLLTQDGVITVMAYPGHPGGAEETTELIQWLRQHAQQRGVEFECLESHFHHALAPRLFVLKLPPYLL
jgi:SAM-dependent methyltransferase